MVYAGRFGQTASSYHNCLARNKISRIQAGNFVTGQLYAAQAAVDGAKNLPYCRSKHHQNCNDYQADQSENQSIFHQTLASVQVSNRR